MDEYLGKRKVELHWKHCRNWSICSIRESLYFPQCFLIVVCYRGAKGRFCGVKSQPRSRKEKRQPTGQSVRSSYILDYLQSEWQRVGIQNACKCQQYIIPQQFNKCRSWSWKTTAYLGPHASTCSCYYHMINIFPHRWTYRQADRQFEAWS